jgi:hypothetical protein
MSQFSISGSPSIVAGEAFDYVYVVLFFIILANLQWRRFQPQPGLPELDDVGARSVTGPDPQAHSV